MNDAARRSTNFRLLLLLCLTVPLPLCESAIGLQTAQGADGPQYVAQTEPNSPAEQSKLFHLPPGFRIELVAAEPDIVKPININFDAAGRLLVTQSYEYPFAAAADRPGRDTIKLIRDTNADGVPDAVTTFADGFFAGAAKEGSRQWAVGSGKTSRRVYPAGVFMAGVTV